MSQPRAALLVKRALDVCVATLGVILLAPIAAVIAAAIWLDSPGPVLFRQTRIGKGGTAFGMLKFRTMVVGAHAQRASLAALNESIGCFPNW